jgi:serine/threonine protein kinase
VVKQASLCLTRREAECLRRLANEPGFPRLLSYTEDPAADAGLLTIERIEGVDVRTFAAGLAGREDSTASVARFCGELLERVRSMRMQGITHRDVRPAILIVRGGSPVLIDFGWAGCLPDDSAFVPESLGEGYRPEGHGFDDAYSAGKLLLELFAASEPGLASVLSSLSATEPRHRLSLETAIGLLRRFAGVG